MPERMVTLRPFKRPLSPLKSLSTTAFLRSWLTENSNVGGATLDAEVGGRTDGAEDRRGLEEFLGRDASPMQAGSTYLVPLDNGDGHPGGGAVERGCVPSRSATDHDDVELVLCAHRRPFVW